NCRRDYLFPEENVMSSSFRPGRPSAMMAMLAMAVCTTGACEEEEKDDRPVPTYLKASNPGIDNGFGTSMRWSRQLSVREDELVVGAPRESSGAVGVDGEQQDDSAPDSGA